MLTFLNSFFENFTGQQRLFFSIVLIVIVALLFTLGTSDNHVSTGIVALVSLALVYLGQPLWLPPGIGKTRVRLASITAIGAIAIPYPWWSVLLIEWVNNNKPDSLKNIPLPDGSIPASVMVFVLAGIFIINYLMRDTTAMLIHPDPTGKTIGDDYFQRDLKGIVEALKIDLDRINRETNWNNRLFEPLDAEVEIKKSGKTTRKVTKLLKAIKEDRETQAFLVLGDPGSGKSVALRKLASELLKEVPQTGKIPVYLNLREWRVTERWTKDSKPTVDQLQDFLQNQLQKDVFVREFLNQTIDKNSDETMFSKLFKDGRFFLILDSFDEIPQVLDENEKSWLISELSNVIYRFLVVGHQSRGILASRLFRCPDANFNAKNVLEIRPFSETQIFSYLTRRRAYDETKIKELLREKWYLVPAFRNPFTLGLVPLYSRCNPNQFPSNQNQLYQVFLQNRLESVQGEINERNHNRDQNNLITQESVLKCAKDIAWVLFDNENFGFEAPYKKLIKVLCDEYEYNRDNIEDIIDILRSAQIARMGLGIDKLFSFVHRRFAEYLVAKTFDQRSLDQLPIESIPKDTQWREALALYCEVTSPEKAKKIADYCWDRVKLIGCSPLMEEYSNKMNTPEFLDSIHSLRFLTTAFRSRLDCIQSFQQDLTELLLKIISDKSNQQNLLSVKFAVEALGLLKPEDTNRGIIESFQFQSDWISETALYACRNLPIVNNLLIKKIKYYISEINDDDFISRREELIFSFSLSDALKSLNLFCRLRILEIILYRRALFLILVSNPFINFGLYFVLYIFLLVMKRIREIIGPLSPEYSRENLFSLLFLLTISYSFIGTGETPLYISIHLQVYCQILAIIGIALAYIFFIIQLIRDFNRDTLFILGLNIFFLCFIFSLKQNFFRFFEPLLSWLHQIIDIELILLITNISLMTIASIFLLGSIYLSIPKWKDAYHDMQKNKILFRKTSDPDHVWTRGEISNQFLSLNTPSGRFKFVQHLEEKRVTPPEDSKWPEGILPNVNNDRATALLAKLEERWLGLNR